MSDLTPREQSEIISESVKFFEKQAQDLIDQFDGFFKSKTKEIENSTGRRKHKYKKEVDDFRKKIQMIKRRIEKELEFLKNLEQ